MRNNINEQGDNGWDSGTGWGNNSGTGWGTGWDDKSGWGNGMKTPKPVTPKPVTPKQVMPDWSTYPCVVSLANSKGVKIDINGAYLIGNFRYFANGRKGDLTTRKVLDYTCNDPEFKTQQTPDKTQKSNTQLKYRECPEVHPVEFGCKNNLVKTFQKCLGVKDDGKFGPITRQKMEDLGLRGDVITAKERIAVCSRLDPVTPETQNLGYEDYTNDEYEDSSEKPEQEYSTGYEDYTLEEN
jgi:hypothetical protein